MEQIGKDYKINPCKASLSNFKNKSIGDIQGSMNEINSICYGVCNAYGNPDGCDNICADFINDINFSLGNKQPKCTPKRPTVPVIWNNIPRLFPQIYKKERNIEKALSKSIKLCSLSPLPLECKNMCIIDANAIIESKNIVQPPKNNEKRPNIPAPKIINYTKFNPGWFYTFLILTTLICSIFIAFLLKIVLY
jgi:hypothetical protein